MAPVGRFLKAPSTHYFLFGPRGTGKSTWLRQAYPDALWVDLLRPEEQVERHPRPRFVLTGSSARKLRREGVDLLAGRAVLRALHPFMAAELGDRFDFARALVQGLVPLVWSSREPADVLAAYAGLDRLLGGRHTLSFWRTKAGTEGRLRRLRPGRLLGPGGQALRHHRPADLRGLKAFRDDYPEAVLRLLYRGAESLEIDGIRCLPCDAFLRRLVPGEPLP